MSSLGTLVPWWMVTLFKALKGCFTGSALAVEHQGRDQVTHGQQHCVRSTKICVWNLVLPLTSYMTVDKSQSLNFFIWKRKISYIMIKRKQEFFFKFYHLWSPYYLPGTLLSGFQTILFRSHCSTRMTTPSSRRGKMRQVLIIYRSFKWQGYSSNRSSVLKMLLLTTELGGLPNVSPVGGLL